MMRAAPAMATSTPPPTAAMNRAMPSGTEPCEAKELHLHVFLVLQDERDEQDQHHQGTGNRGPHHPGAGHLARFRGGRRRFGRPGAGKILGLRPAPRPPEPRQQDRCRPLGRRLYPRRPRWGTGWEKRRWDRGGQIRGESGSWRPYLSVAGRRTGCPCCPACPLHTKCADGERWPCGRRARCSRVWTARSGCWHGADDGIASQPRDAWSRRRCREHCRQRGVCERLPDRRSGKPGRDVLHPPAAPGHGLDRAVPARRGRTAVRGRGIRSEPPGGGRCACRPSAGQAGTLRRNALPGPPSGAVFGRRGARWSSAKSTSSPARISSSPSAGPEFTGPRTGPPAHGSPAGRSWRSARTPCVRDP